jgi:hypothetical protein
VELATTTAIAAATIALLANAATFLVAQLAIRAWLLLLLSAARRGGAAARGAARLGGHGDEG